MAIVQAGRHEMGCGICAEEAYQHALPANAAGEGAPAG